MNFTNAVSVKLPLKQHSHSFTTLFLSSALSF
jgi:hypothetical protein